jgi:hypothetical protein
MEIVMLQIVYQLQYGHSVGQNIIKIVMREWQNSEYDGLMHGIFKHQDPTLRLLFITMSVVAFNGGDSR